MMVKKKLNGNMVLVMVLAFGLMACKGNGTKSDADIAEAEHARYALLNIPQQVDMGVFEGDSLKKTVSLQLSNTGNDTLYILGAVPKCECTEVSLADSVVAPYSSTVVTATLDLSAYPAVRTEKTFGIISNNRDGQVVRVSLIGERR